MGKVFWVDEEENVAYPDVMTLRYGSHEVVLVCSAPEALDWIVQNADEIDSFAAFVIDIQLPVDDDPRFDSEKTSKGTFAGLKLCDILREQMPKLWGTMKHKVVLYTRLPDQSRFLHIRDYAKQHDVRLVHKTHNEYICNLLMDWGLI